MKHQTPAEGVMLTADFPESKFYTVACRCGNPDDYVSVNVESDAGEVIVHFWTKCKTPWWNTSGILHRISMTWKLWTQGYLAYDSWTILSEQQALNFAETLKSAIGEVKASKEEAS